MYSLPAARGSELTMVDRVIGAAEPPVPTSPGFPVDRGGPGDSIPAGRILAGRVRVLGPAGSTPEGPLYHAEYLNGLAVEVVILRSDGVAPEGVASELSRRERFDQAKQIKHPNVAAVHEVGDTDDGSVYVVLERLVGEPLSNLLASGHLLTHLEVLDLALQTAAGLQAAHGAGFVHGNLSPHATLVTKAADGQSQVKLIGFTLEPAFRRPGAKQLPIPEASAGYASPERLIGHPPDERSDVFSLGAVLHRLLTGKAPNPGRVDRSAPKFARPVLHTALRRDPDRRFQTISELHEALKRLAPVAATEPERAILHRGLLAGAVSVGLALVTGAIYLLSGSNWRVTGGERLGLADTTGRAGAEADSPFTRGARAPAPSRQDAARNGRADRDRSPTGASGDPARRAARPQSAPLGPDAPTPAALERPRNRQTEDSPATPDVLGYMGEPASSLMPSVPPDTPDAPEARQARATPPTRPTADPRPRAELERNQALRLSIGDVLRLELAQDVAEIRPGVLLVALTPAAMDASTIMYHLQRLYLAYSAATEHRSEVALELRRGRELYGWFTRDGLREASSD
jgi:eukaryotic-like serine/threonine-protein kinase